MNKEEFLKQIDTHLEAFLKERTKIRIIQLLLAGLAITCVAIQASMRVHWGFLAFSVICSIICSFLYLRSLLGIIAFEKKIPELKEQMWKKEKLRQSMIANLNIISVSLDELEDILERRFSNDQHERSEDERQE